MPFPKILVFSLISLFLLYSGLLGQKKGLAEVDVAKCWSYPLGETVGGQVVSDGSRVFLALGGAKVEALTLDGKKIWSSEFGGEISSNVLANDTGLFLVTLTGSIDAARPGGNRLRSLSKETGITNWTVILSDASRYWLGRFHGEVIVVSKNGVIQSVDAKNGNVKWKREIAEGFVAEPVFTATAVLVATTGNQIFGISMANGEIGSMRKIPFGVTSLSETTNGELIVGDERGNVYSLDSAGKQTWKFKTGGQISNVLPVGDNILVTSHDNFVYFLRSRNGGRVWKMRLSGRVSGVATYADSYAVISTIDEHRAMLIDLKSGKIAGQAFFDDDETTVQIRPHSGQLMFFLTNKTLNACSLSACPPK